MRLEEHAEIYPVHPNVRGDVFKCDFAAQIAAQVPFYHILSFSHHIGGLLPVIDIHYPDDILGGRKLVKKVEEIQVASVCDELVQGMNLTAGVLTGGSSREMQRENPDSIIVATPGRLIEYLEKGWINTETVEMYVIDEADRMLDMGFRDDVAKITRELYNRFQTMLFSATLEGSGINEFASMVLNNPIEIRIGTGGEADEMLPTNLQSRAYYAAGDTQKIKILHHLLTTVKGRSIVFVKTKERLSKLDGTLRRWMSNIY